MEILERNGTGEGGDHGRKKTKVEVDKGEKKGEKEVIGRKKGKRYVCREGEGNEVGEGTVGRRRGRVSHPERYELMVSNTQYLLCR